MRESSEALGAHALDDVAHAVLAAGTALRLEAALAERQRHVVRDHEQLVLSVQRQRISSSGANGATA